MCPTTEKNLLWHPLPITKCVSVHYTEHCCGFLAALSCCPNVLAALADRQMIKCLFTHLCFTRAILPLCSVLTDQMPAVALWLRTQGNWLSTGQHMRDCPNFSVDHSVNLSTDHFQPIECVQLYDQVQIFDGMARKMGQNGRDSRQLNILTIRLLGYSKDFLLSNLVKVNLYVCPFFLL